MPSVLLSILKIYLMCSNASTVCFCVQRAELTLAFDKKWELEDITLWHYTLTGGQVVQLIMEYVPLGSLREFLPKRKLGIPQCLMFAQQICQVS